MTERDGLTARNHRYRAGAAAQTRKQFYTGEEYMARNTSGLKRDAGPGRPAGRSNKVPASFKASCKRIFEEISSEDPAILKNAILRGLKGRPREAFPYVQLAAYYLDGKPKEQVHVDGSEGGMVVVRFTDA